MPTQFFPATGGIDFTRPTYARFPTYWADLVNFHVDGNFLVGGIGWAAMGTEVASGANGVITHVTGMSKSTEVLERIIVGAKRALRWTGADWAEIQDATDFSGAATDPMDSTFWNDLLYIVVPVDGAANNMAQTTGAADITRVAGTPRNARFVRQFGNRLCTWGTFNGATYNSTEFQISDLNTATTWSAVNRVALDETGDGAAGMESLDKVLLLFKVRSSPVMVEITDNPDNPFFYIMLPGALGMLNPMAQVKAGQHGVIWCGIRNIHLFNDTNFPQDVGDPVRAAIYPNLAAASRVLGGYEYRRADREAIYFVSNIATTANEFVPNSVAVTNQYIAFDFKSQAWFRGDLGANAPRAIGNYFVQVGDRDYGSSTVVGTMLALDSAGGTTVYDMNHDTTTRAGATFTCTAVTPICDFGSPKRKKVNWIMPVFDNVSSGTMDVKLYGAEAAGQVPTQLGTTRSIQLDGTETTAPWADFQSVGEGRFLQAVFSTTARMNFYGYWMSWDEVGNDLEDGGQ